MPPIGREIGGDGIRFSIEESGKVEDSTVARFIASKDVETEKAAKLKGVATSSGGGHIDVKISGNAYVGKSRVADTVLM